MIPDDPVSFWQYFDLIILSVLTVVLTLMLVSHRKRHGKLLNTISETIAHDRKSNLLYSLVMTVCFPLYYAFIWFWVAPLMKMPPFFYFLLVVTALSELVFVWVPATRGKSKIIHEVSAGLVGVMMLVALILILIFGSGLSAASTISIVLFLVISLILGLAVLSSRSQSRVLTYEITYIAAFLITISIVGHN